MRMLGKAQLGATTFCGASYPNDKCGANGLPLTPNSIKILGRFQRLKALDHPRLCKYVHLLRGKHERVMVVSEHYRENLKNINKEKFTEPSELLQLAYDVLDGLKFLNEHNIVHRCLAPENLLIDPEGRVKLREHGMYYMTDYGADVSFPIGKAKYLAPEVIAQGPVKVTDGELDSDHPPSGPKVDVWSLGIILLETFLDVSLWNCLTMQQICYKVTGFLKTDIHPLDLIVKEHGVIEKIKELPQTVVDLLRQCLIVCPRKRPNPKDLLSSTTFQENRQKEPPYMNGFSMFSTTLRCKDLELPSYHEGKAPEEDDLLSERSIEEVFYLWGLAGGDLESTLKKAGLIRSRPPITALSKFVTEDGELFGQDKDRSVLLDDTVVILSQEQLRQRLQSIEDEAYYPLLEDENSASKTSGLPTSPSNVSLSETVSLPLVIREKDIEYQFHRIVLYDRLLKAYPYKRPHIWQEARVDIPPHVRAKVWAALLELEGDVYGRYDAIDKETVTATDRQIEVDVPRCHQYNELLSSPTGHAKFKRLLKAWVVSHPQYVYWQGLDSLCAPFLYLNFNDEALAYSCLSAFIPKYLHKFFLKDNSPIIQEYLAVFSHLITFHDPELANHLDGIGFIPDLYAIPWFLTMYAHVFPLHRIFHLWDTLLLGNSSFPLCIGVAILQQLRDQLLSFGFNECILLFSDMPEIDIEKCVQDSIKIFCQTPKSATYRQHARPRQVQGEGKNGRPNVSYYSQDYHDAPKTDLSMEPIPVEELKSERCPRISAEDLIELCELGGSSPTRSPTKASRGAKPKIAIIDVRSKEEYARGSFPGSNCINIPNTNAFTPDGELVPSAEVNILNSHFKNQVKVIVGSRGKGAVQFAEGMLKLKYPKVCVLHKGIDVMRSTGLLVVPPPDL